MFYREIQDPLNINFIHTEGGLGDLIGALPVYQYIYKNHPHVTAHIWIPDFGLELAQRSLPVDPRINLNPFSKLSTDYQTKNFARATGYGSQHTNLATHQTVHAFNLLLNVGVGLSDMNYLRVRNDDIDINKFSLPEKYFVVSTGFTTLVRQWKGKHVNPVVQFIKSKGYVPVFLGKQSTFNGLNHTIKGSFDQDIDYTQGIDLIDKTSLLESQKIIENSKGIVGLDNGLLHLAGTSHIPIVGGFTTVKPEHRMPVRNNVLGWNYYPIMLSEKELPCSGCQSLWSFTYNHEFQNCYYKDLKCVELLTSDKYIKQLDKIL